MTFLSNKKAKEEEKRDTVSIVRRSPKKKANKIKSIKKKRKKGDSFESVPKNIDIDDDDDLSDTIF